MHAHCSTRLQCSSDEANRSRACSRSRLKEELEAAHADVATAAAASEKSARCARETIDRLQAEAQALRAETATADAEIAAGTASQELRSQRFQLEASSLKLQSMERMLNAQLVASQASHDAERRLRAELNDDLHVQQASAEYRQQQAYALAQLRAAGTDENLASPRASAADASGVGIPSTPSRVAGHRGTAPVEHGITTEAAMCAVEEVEALRAQLGAAHAATARLQEELCASEGELHELQEGSATPLPCPTPLPHSLAPPRCPTPLPHPAAPPRCTFSVALGHTCAFGDQFPSTHTQT